MGQLKTAAFFLFLLSTRLLAEPKQPLKYDYHLPSQIYDDVLGDRKTELWARVYVPDPMPTQRLPLVLILHGNHATCGRSSAGAIGEVTCEYTKTQQCTSGFSVINNHLGYEYFANELAQKNYIVVSVNANLGITCGASISTDPGLNLSRGRLLLKHLELLAGWNSGKNQTGDLAKVLFQKIDLNSIGLMGHSRGGEGVRAAYNLYQDPQEGWYQKIGPAAFKAIYEIAPVNGQSGRMLNADNIPWNLLLSACDGDVSDLEGIRVYDRMNFTNLESANSPKSVLFTWGTNHNFYNTEWQDSDASTCYDHTPVFPMAPGSPVQRDLLTKSAVPFFTAHVGANADPKLAAFFDPGQPLPKELSDLTTIDRSFIPKGGMTGELTNFWWISAAATPDFIPPVFSKVTQEGLHIPEQEIGVNGSKLTWTSASDQTFASFFWMKKGSGMLYPNSGFFEFRVSRAVRPIPEKLDFMIQLIGDNDNLSNAVPLIKYISILGPAAKHALLQTVRIPAKDFTGVDRFRGIRFTFSKTNAGSIYLSQLALRSADTALDGTPVKFQPNLDRRLNLLSAIEKAKVIHAAKMEGASDTLAGDTVRVQMSSPRPFTAKDSMLLMAVGARIFNISGYETDGDLRHVAFEIPREDYNALQRGERIRVFYGSAPDREVWDLGEWQ